MGVSELLNLVRGSALNMLTPWPSADAWIGECPVCDRRGCIRIQRDQRLFYCFNCGEQGDLAVLEARLDAP